MSAAEGGNSTVGRTRRRALHTGRMPHADFVHLRVHSAYSLSEGAIKAEKIPALALEANMPAVAITDTANLFGALEFSQACAAKGIQPIIGCQIALARADNPRLPPEPIVLLAQDAIGLDNLRRLSSLRLPGHRSGPEAAACLRRDRRHAAGLILLTGGSHRAARASAGGGPEAEAERLLARIARGIPRPRGCRIAPPQPGRPSARWNPGLIALADAAGIPLVATNDCYFPAPDMYEAHDALLAIAEGRLLSERGSPPRHAGALVQARARHARPVRRPAGGVRQHARHRAALRGDDGDAQADAAGLAQGARGQHRGGDVRAMAIEGLDRRMDAMDADAATRTRYRERLDYELSVIGSMGFAGYFLIVADFIQWAKAQGIPVGPGRGSGAGSVAAWALTITDLDPIRFDLLFERFLNPERVSMPDFDIDFCQEGRDA